MTIARSSSFYPNCAFLIKKSCSKSTVEKQERFGSSLRGGVLGDSVGAGSFG